MKADSPFWNLELGVCEKHGLPELPCPACMAGEGDEDVTFKVEEIDVDVARAEQIPLRDLVPSNFKNPKFR